MKTLNVQYFTTLGIAAMLCVVGFASTPPTLAAGPTVYGRQLLQTLEVPPDALAKFANFQAANKGGGGAGLLADSQDWLGPAQTMASNGNPYTLVVKVQGTVVADGDVTTLWQTGWSLEGTTRLSRVPTIGTKEAKAGMPFSGEATAGPTSFKEENTYSPMLGLVQASNVKIQSVKVEVWSGIGKTSWLEKFFASTPLLTGLVFLGLVVWWRRR